MRVRIRLVWALAALVFPLAPQMASAADVSLAAAGMTEFHFPGTPGCNTPVALGLKSVGSDFVYRGLLAGGTPQTPAAEISPCPLVFFNLLQTSEMPENRTCVNAPAVGPTGNVTGPSTLSVTSTTYTITEISDNCANTRVKTVTTLRPSGAQNVIFSFDVYLGGATIPTYWADGTLTRASA